MNQKVKTIRSDNGTEFKNKDVIESYGSKGIKREYSNARTPQQNRVAERKNMTLIEAARTMLADSFSTACYVLNRVLVTKPQNKTPYELITGKIPIISYIRPFGCHVTILNTIDHLGKFEEKSDEGFLVGYSLNSKAFRVYNLETKRVEENLYINFLENKPNVAGKGPTWLFNLDYLTNSMNYQPVTAENKANITAGPKEANNSEEAKNGGEKPNVDIGSKINEEPVDQAYQVFLEELERLKRQEKEANNAAKTLRKEFAQDTEDLLLQVGAARASSTNYVNTTSTPVNTASPSRNVRAAGLSYPDPSNASYDDEGAVADFTNLETIVNIKPKKISQALEDESWVDAMQEEMLQNKKDERGVVVRNKVTLVAQGHKQEEGMDYDEVFAPVARIEAIRIFLAFASYMRFIVYQMDVKSAFLDGTIDEEVKQKEDGIFISQDKYVVDILKKFDFMSVKTASTPIETQKPLVKDEEDADVDVHLYRSMIGSLMYLTASRPDIMFAVCACSRFQVTLKTLHLHAMKRIFRYLKGKPKLGLWYLRVLAFDLEAYSDSDYAGTNLDRKSIIEGCQFLGMRLISWQCKKQIIMATSTTEAEYVAAANCCMDKSKITRKQSKTSKHGLENQKSTKAGSQASVKSQSNIGQ
ncbi:putative ribonuclease H-like domain-containing protein [Tanacetum coccineum]